MTTAHEKYEATAVGATAILIPAPRQDDEAFSSDVRDVQRMEAEGFSHDHDRASLERVRTSTNWPMFSRLR